jgi:hypothetical protein
MLNRYAALIAVCFGVGVAQSQAILTPSATATVDTSAVQARADSAYALAASAVKTVGGAAPDAGGNAPLPSTFNAVTCASCTMTGATTLNGSPIAVTPDVAAETSARISAVNGEVTARNAAINAIVFPVTSVNGLTGAVTMPVYTDAMAVAANSAAVTSATNIARAAAADVIQIVAPSTGGTVVSAAGTNVLFINNTGVLASLTVTFPPAPVDGQRFTVAANGTITTLGFTGATSKGAAATLAASGYARFVWSSSLGLWFRVG